MKARQVNQKPAQITIDQAMEIWVKDKTEDKVEFIEALDVKHYTSLVHKKVIAEKAMYTAHAVYADKNDPNAVPMDYSRDSVKEYHANVVALLSSYTNLKIVDENTFDLYDRLQSTGALRVILNAIGSDLEEWTRIWTMVRDDFMETHFSMQGVMKAQMLGMLADVVAQAADKE